MEQARIALVGTGNLAWHLGHALVDNGISIDLVLARSLSSARQIADELNVIKTGRPEELDKGIDICLICVSDDAITQVLDTMKKQACLMIHTAGSVSMDVFTGRAENWGVLYPCQSLTKGRPLNYRKMPILIEANTTWNLNRIRLLAEKISDRVIEADSTQRLYLHLAAVFANNFSNHLFAIAEKLTLEHNLSFDLIKPLIEETSAKIISMSPQDAQTGPAVRGSKKVLEKHMVLLQDHPEWQRLYQCMSESIAKMKPLAEHL